MAFENAYADAHVYEQSKSVRVEVITITAASGAYRDELKHESEKVGESGTKVG